MRKVILTLLALFIWYLAAMFHLYSLLALALSLLLVMLVMFIHSCWLKRHTALAFLRASAICNVDETLRCPLRAKGAGSFRVRLSLSYWDEKGIRTAMLKSSGDTDEIELRTPWCGLLHVRVQRAIVYDALSLFGARVTVCGELCAAILPLPLPLKAIDVQDQKTEGALPQRGSGDTWQLRAYAPGDPSRRLHWNLSARSDALWVKEDEQTLDQAIVLTLTGAQKTYDPHTLHVFFTVLVSLIAGVLHAGRPLRLIWDDVCVLIHDDEETQDALLQLYQKLPSSAPLVPGLTLSLDLMLSAGEWQICQFTPADHEEQLRQLTLVLGGTQG